MATLTPALFIGLYVEGVRHPSDKLTWIYEGFEYGSISLRSYMLS